MIITNLSTSNISFIGKSHVAYEVSPNGGSLNIINGEIPDTEIQALIAKGAISVSGFEKVDSIINLGSLISGEDPNNSWLGTADGASQYVTSRSGLSDRVLGSTGSFGDYLKSVVVVVNSSANSQVILKDGAPTTLLSSGVTHASTASTTTVISSSINTSAITVNQYAGYILRIAGQARRIVSNPASAAGSVNAFTLDHALQAVPGLGVAFSVESIGQSFELIPTGVPAGTYSIPLGLKSANGGWKVTTDIGVTLVATGKFT